MGKALGWTGWEWDGDRGVSLNHAAQPTKQGHGTLGTGLIELTEVSMHGHSRLQELQGHREARQVGLWDVGRGKKQ